MKHKTQKSGKKAFSNVFGFFPKRYLLLGVLPMVLSQGCKKEDPPAPKPEPIPTPKIDHPTNFVMKTDNLPEGVTIDTSNKTITVPPSMTNDAIIKLFEQGTVTDTDGDTGIKTVKIEDNKVRITIYGKNGKTGEREEKRIEWDLIISDIVAEFPEQIILDPITAGDKNIIPQLFATPISLNDGTTATAQIQVNGETITSDYIFNTPGTYTLTLTVIDSKNTPHTKEYQITVNPLEVVKNDISKYKEYKKSFQSIDPTRQDRWQIETIAARMHLGPFMKITNTLLKPSGKHTAILNIKERQHHIEKTIKEIIGNNPEIKYTDISPQDRKNNSEVRKKVQELLNTFDFVVFENNGWHTDTLRNMVDQSNVGYVFSAESGSAKNDPERQSNSGNGIVNFPGRYKSDNGRLYTDIGMTWANPEHDPLTNSIDSPILIGLAFGGTSYATEGNAAIGTVLVNFCHRMGIPMDKATLDALLKRHPERLEPAYYAYYPKGAAEIGKNIVWTDKVVAHLFNFEKFVQQIGTFALNPEITRLSEAEPRVPLFKNYDKLNYDHLKLAEEKGIVRQDGIPYVSYEKLLQQGVAPEEIKHLDYSFVFGDDTTSKYWWKGEHVSPAQ